MSDRAAPDPVRVVVVDDQPLIRAGFTALLEAEDDIEVVGDALLGPSVTRRLVEHFVAGPARGHDPPDLALLTEREQEVLGVVARGLSNDEVAAELHISPATVKTHVGRVMAKLGAHDRAQLVVAAYESGLVVPRAAG